ncbi:ankyrin repeat and EF-hand domain-containing protein 1 isoform X1 [Onychostoma macrolepis]|uniref:ankyrin repeat and EF-hand domain-containing protein 1 isoform X1 n=1 Tax=Onychostoma macrolepis TaxID=369639 RepID=UPI00272C9FF8|nr:ankyrin repeat and EF-hand domain-containing protein 1 isoform X1 [Onychostoma macrolepis]XP_058605135.1 ankyrin repeat and EF-hand domain-containing protein 1 isoform X1 [Onychostoma macrolepis]
MEETSESVMMSWVAEGNLEVLQIYKLLQYVREKDKPQINKMVDMGVSSLLNLTEPKQGLGALYQASLDRDEDLIRFLLSLGAHPDIQDKKGRTPLMLAAQLGYFNIVYLLITNHANVNLTDEEGKGVLFYCISPAKEHALCLQMALSCNANVNNVSNSGKPLLVFACENAKDCEDLCIHILEKGADPNAVNQVTRCSALMEASKAGAVKLVRAILQKGGNPDLLDQEGKCAAHFAAEGGFLEVLKVLSAYSADLGISSTKDNTPLHFAATGGFNECCRFLAQRGCNPKLKNLEGQLPSQVAKSNGHKAALKELKKAEKMHVKLSAPDAVNPNELWAVTLHDWSCEHETTLRKAFETAEGLDKLVENVSVENFVSSLQAHQVPVSNENLQRIIMEHDKNRESVINVNDFFKGLKYLQKAFVISSYAPKQAKKGKGGKEKKSGKSASSLPICIMPPEQISVREDSGLPYYMIENYQPFTDTNRFNPDRPPVHPIENDSAWYIDEPEKNYSNIHYCVKTGDLESLSLAFTQQVPVDVKDQFFKTPLMTACSCGNYKVAKFLISLRADVNAVDQFNWTPLHHACHAGHVDITIMLVQSGAVVDAVAMNGATPLMRAIESCRFSCVEYLIKAGANIMAKNKRDQNCLDIAINYGDARIISMLMAKFSRKDKEKPTLKIASSAQEKMRIRSPAPLVSAAVKKDLRDNIIVKNPKFKIRRGTNKSDISFVPKTLWGKHLTNSPQHTEKEKGTL